MAKFGERTFEQKLVGIANYKSGETRIKFTLVQDGKTEKTFKGGSTSITVNLADLPKKPKIGQNATGTIRIRMSSDGTEVEALTPVTGVFNLRLVNLGKRDGEDAPPMPYLKTWNEGTPKENTYLEFFAVYEITEGKFKGVQLPAYKLHYKFEEDVPHNPGFTRFAGSFAYKQATRLFQLRDWGALHGLWEVTGDGVEGEPIEWDDETILPELEERALENDISVRGVMKDGYIKELLPLDEEDVEPYGEPDLDNVDEILEEEPEPVRTKKVSEKAAPTKAGSVKKIKKSKVEDEELDEL